MDKTLKTAVFQMDISWENPEINLEKIERQIHETDAELIVLPEMFTTGFSMQPSRVAQTTDSEITRRLSAMASKSGKALLGSIAIDSENSRNGQRIYVNRLFFFLPDGTHRTYDKRHTFRMGGEHLVYDSGSEKIVVEYKGFRICPLICYDLRFPVWSRNTGDYDILIYVANWPEVRKHAWSSLLTARAIENLSYCIGANRCGQDPTNNYSGESIILDYMGKPIVTAETGKEEVITAELSLEKLEKFRAKFPAHLDADKFEIKI